MTALTLACMVEHINFMYLQSKQLKPTYAACADFDSVAKDGGGPYALYIVNYIFVTGCFSASNLK